MRKVEQVEVSGELEGRRRLKCSVRGGDSMSDDGRATYRLQAPSAEAPCISVFSRRVCPLLKATRVWLSVTCLLKDTFNYTPLSRDHFFHELCVSLACALRSGTNWSTCCFLPPIKEHVDRLRLPLVCASLTHLEEDDEHVGGGGSKLEGGRRDRDGGWWGKNMHMNPEGLMCLHYLGCDLSPTSSTSIMHHIHKWATDLGAPATHSYYFNWIKSVQISRAWLPHCGFSILVVIWFVRCITLPPFMHGQGTSYVPPEL